MANSTILQVGVVVAIMLACGMEQSIGLPLGEREDKDTTSPEYLTLENDTATSNTSGKINTTAFV